MTALAFGQATTTTPATKAKAAPKSGRTVELTAGAGGDVPPLQIEPESGTTGPAVGGAKGGSISGVAANAVIDDLHATAGNGGDGSG